MRTHMPRLGFMFSAACAALTGRPLSHLATRRHVFRSYFSISFIFISASASAPMSSGPHMW